MEEPQSFVGLPTSAPVKQQFRQLGINGDIFRVMHLVAADYH
jgi:hypothetical protein